MNDNTLTPDRYAGDEAWQDWFDICSVGGCPAEHSGALRRQVESAMYSTLSKRGVSREEAGADDPVAVFDAYFKLKGSRETKKPLKSYFAYRIKVEGMRLADFVCGTLFGSGAGRVHDAAASNGRARGRRRSPHWSRPPRATPRLFST